jgi:mRNA-degrading endonuclease RelE of RelBE toxin-antitoxin system
MWKVEYTKTFLKEMADLPEEIHASHQEALSTSDSV